MTAFADLLSIQRACHTLGLNTARPTIWFRHGDSVADVAVATGTSKVGGEPDLPPGIVWPSGPALADPDGTAEKFRASANTATPCSDFVVNHLAQEMPMSFLAQVDLGAISREPGFDPVLSDRGMLWAFKHAT